MARLFPLPAGARAVSAFSAALGLLTAWGCDQNMSDRPLPRAAAEDLSRISDRLSEAPSLSVPAGASISGMIELDPRLASLTAPSDVVFVIARDPSNDQAPPLAVERLTGNAYPMRFVLDAGSAMLPDAALAGPVQLIVKVDKDGDAGTASPEDLLGFTPEPVEPGDAKVHVTLEATLGEVTRAVQADTAAPAAGPDPSVPGASTATAGTGLRIEGTIDLPPSLASRTSPSDVLFVTARAPGTAGPPAAVARLSGNRYPMRFVLDDSNRMLGGPWPETLEIQVRLDRDGDPLTRDPEDLTGRAAAPVRPGENGVRLRLGA